MIGKSGGNTYHGSFLKLCTRTLISSAITSTVSWRPRAFAACRSSAAGTWPGTRAVYVLKDRLWWYTGGVNGRVNDNGVLDCRQPDGTQCETLLTQRFYSIKGTYRLSDAHRLNAYYQWNLKDNTTGASALAAWESRFHQTLTGNMGKGEWTGTLRNNLLATALVGFWNYDSLQESVSDKPATWDVVTQQRTGASSLNYFTPNLFTFDRYQASGSISWFTARTRTGDHNIKAGLDYMRGGERVQRDGARRQRRLHHALLQRGAISAARLQSPDRRTGGRPLRRDLREGSMDGRSPTDAQRRLPRRVRSGYIPDEHKPAGTFAQVYPALSVSRVNGAPWNTIVPRIHALYVLTKSGFTVIKGGWGASRAGARHERDAGPQPALVEQHRLRLAGSERQPGLRRGRSESRSQRLRFRWHDRHHVDGGPEPRREHADHHESPSHSNVSSSRTSPSG